MPYFQTRRHLKPKVKFLASTVPWTPSEQFLDLLLLYLYYYPQDYKTLFLIAFAPGLLAVVSSLFLQSKKQSIRKEKIPVHFFSFLHYWKQSPAEYRKLVIGLLTFTLFNSSDVFLLLKAKQSGLDDTTLIGVYIFYNLIYALFAFPLGVVADNIGLKKVFLIGLTLFALVYFGMAVNGNAYVYLGLFFLYGIYAAATEGISKAWISNIVNKKDTATAIGTFSGLQSICTMMASSLTGLIWFQFDAAAAFVTTAIVTLIVIVYLLTVPKPVMTTSSTNEP
jgi:MFS family permease